MRRLKREGVSYRQLVDEVRKERCISLMRRGVTASSELAQQLCYSDGAYVYRAFQRWTGMSLVEAKRKLAQNPNELVTIFHSEKDITDDMLSGASKNMPRGEALVSCHSSNVG